MTVDVDDLQRRALDATTQQELERMASMQLVVDSCGRQTQGELKTDVPSLLGLSAEPASWAPPRVRGANPRLKGASDCRIEVSATDTVMEGEMPTRSEIQKAVHELLGELEQS